MNNSGSEALIWPLVIVLFFFFIGPRSKTEGVYETTHLECEKPHGSDKWRNKWRDSSDRWDAISSQEYQVSFENQRVVNRLPYVLSDCTVYDRDNWVCRNAYVVRDGEMMPQCDKLDDPDCTVPIGMIAHALVYVAGADWYCRRQTTSLDIWFEGEMRRQQLTP